MLSKKSLKNVQVLLFILLIVVLLVGIVSYFLMPEFYTRLTIEDGVIENATALFLLLCSLVCFQKYFRLRSIKNRWWGVITLGMALMAFFVFGEEISWGQRLFNINPVEFFKSNNTQEEMNLHNLSINGFKLNQWIFGNLLTAGLVLYFIPFIPMYKYVPKFSKLINYAGIPIPRVIHSSGIVMTAVTVLIIDSSSRWEILELGFVIVLLMVLLYPQNREQIYSKAES